MKEQLKSSQNSIEATTRKLNTTTYIGLASTIESVYFLKWVVNYALTNPEIVPLAIIPTIIVGICITRIEYLRGIRDRQQFRRTLPNSSPTFVHWE